MGIAARWIRIEQGRRAALRAALAGFARAQAASSAPAVFWTRDGDEAYAYALVVPLKFVPGRPWRWRSWALAPCIAAYRQFGARVYLEGNDLWLGGQRIATSEAALVGACAVVSSSFLARLPCGRADWSEGALVDAFRARIEAQHGWEFDHSWPSAGERLSMEDAAALGAAGTV
jgi:hypothetical protein